MYIKVFGNGENLDTATWWQKYSLQMWISSCLNMVDTISALSELQTLIVKSHRLNKSSKVFSVSYKVFVKDSLQQLLLVM